MPQSDASVWLTAPRRGASSINPMCRAKPGAWGDGMHSAYLPASKRTAYISSPLRGAVSQTLASLCGKHQNIHVKVTRHAYGTVATDACRDARPCVSTRMTVGLRRKTPILGSESADFRVGKHRVPDRNSYLSCPTHTVFMPGTRCFPTRKSVFSGRELGVYPEGALLAHCH